MNIAIASIGGRATASGLPALVLVSSLVVSAKPAAAQTLFSEDFDHPPPYDAILDPIDPGGWEVSLDPFPDWPVHNGIGNYARAQDCGTSNSGAAIRRPAVPTSTSRTRSRSRSALDWTRRSLRAEERQRARRETASETRQVTNPARQRLTTSRKRVLRGAGATPSLEA